MRDRWGGVCPTGNNGGRLSDNRHETAAWLLNIRNRARRFTSMNAKHIIVALVLAASPAGAECYADYKAKQDSPLRLHYGVAQVPDAACGSRGAAADALAPRLAQDGWTLLNILSIFGPEQLESKKDSAGQYFLRY
jgi:hypothetical protein